MKVSIETIWRRQADELRVEAGKCSSGNYRDLLLKRARQLETASQARGWANSTGPKATSRRKSDPEGGWAIVSVPRRNSCPATSIRPAIVEGEVSAASVAGESIRQRG
jgi:hypothetical protein